MSLCNPFLVTSPMLRVQGVIYTQLHNSNIKCLLENKYCFPEYTNESAPVNSIKTYIIKPKKSKYFLLMWKQDWHFIPCKSEQRQGWIETGMCGKELQSYCPCMSPTSVKIVRFLESCWKYNVNIVSSIHRVLLYSK